MKPSKSLRIPDEKKEKTLLSLSLSAIFEFIVGQTGILS